MTIYIHSQSIDLILKEIIDNRLSKNKLTIAILAFRFLQVVKAAARFTNFTVWGFFQTQ